MIEMHGTGVKMKVILFRTDANEAQKGMTNFLTHRFYYMLDAQLFPWSLYLLQDLRCTN